MSIYELHEFQPDRLLSGQIVPTRVIPTKYISYATASNGITVINENTNISNNRSFISLYTTKISDVKFNQIIDLEFKEFPPIIIDTTIRDLQTRISELEASSSVLLATDAANKNLINTLNDQIDSLNKINLIVDQSIQSSNNNPNLIPSEFKVGTKLLSNSSSQNKLQSPNGKYIFQLNSDGSISLFENQSTDSNTVQLRLIKELASIAENGELDERQELRATKPGLYYAAEISPSPNNGNFSRSKFRVRAYYKLDGKDEPSVIIHESQQIDSIESTVVRLLDDGRLVLTVENEAEFSSQNPELTTLTTIMTPF